MGRKKRIWNLMMMTKHKVEDRIRKKGRDFHKAKIGFVVSFKVTFRDFSPVGSNIWFKLYRPPSDRDVDLIGTVIQSWYIMGRLGAYNSSNLQMTSHEHEKVFHCLNENGGPVFGNLRGMAATKADTVAKRRKGQSWILNAGEEDEVHLNVECHYLQANVGGCIFSLGDCVHIKGEGKEPLIGRIVEFFKPFDDQNYFRVQWYFRAEDTVSYCTVVYINITVIRFSSFFR